MNNLFELQKQFETTTSLEQRKLKGQFFTPPEIAPVHGRTVHLTDTKDFQTARPGRWNWCIVVCVLQLCQAAPYESPIRDPSF